MRNMNRTWWGVTNYNTLDTLTHAFHMAEVWDKTAEQYKLVKQLLDPESEICDCITDIENNDVLNYLNLLAFKIKYPGITSGNKTLTDQCKFFMIIFSSDDSVNIYYLSGDLISEIIKLVSILSV